MNIRIMRDCPFGWSRQLFSAQSEFQRIDVLESTEFGKMLVVDGDLMLTEKDEFIYHEMITHVPMAVHPDVKKVLVIGGGDGGVVRELIKYETVGDDRCGGNRPSACGGLSEISSGDCQQPDGSRG